MEETKAMIRELQTLERERIALEEERRATEDKRHKQKMITLGIIILILVIYETTPWVLWLAGWRPE